MANTRSGGGAAGSGARREGHTTVPSTAAAAPTKPPNARETRSTTVTAATNAQTPNLRRSTRENKGKNRYKQVPATLSSHRSATRPTTATAVATHIPMSSPNKTTKLRNTSISPSPPLSQDSSGTSTSAPTPAATKRKAEEDVQTVTTASKKQRRPMSTKEFRTLFNPEEKHSSPVLATSPTEDKKNTSEVQAEDGDAVLVYEASSAQEKEQASREPSSVAGSHQSDLVSEPCMPIETCSLNKAAEIVSMLEAGEQDAGDSNQNSLPELRNRACSTDHHEEASKAIEDVDSIGTQGPCTSRHSETIHCDETDYDDNMCVGCKIRETSDILKSCDGKGCKRRYHLSCMDPPLDVSLGIWLCIICTKKRLQFGVYSVSDGIESLWDVKEGVDNSKQYFVKYKNLAHVHNRWVSESDIVDSTPQGRDLISKFSKRIHKEKTIRWRQEWAEPHRLLKKRALMPPKEAESFFNSLGDKFVCCNVEWLVKWKDLGYEHATWELEASSFLCTPEAQELKRSYVNRIEAARKSSDPAKVDKVKEGVFQKLQRLPDGCPPGLDDDHLSSLNQLREFWYNSHGAVLIDDQERVIKTILFVASILPHISQPLLIVSTSASLSLWETKFSRLAAAINVVVYNGEKDVRQSIQNLEFYEDGSVMFQVLLTHPDAVFEDIEAIEQISWETVIVDDCQNSRVSKCLEQLKRLPTSFRMVLLCSSLKENIPEYMNLLSFLNPEGNGILSVSNSISFDTAGTLAMLKTKLASYVAFERKATKFSEYWVPARLSTVQLELYCYTLLSNSPALRSHSKTDNVGALRNILVSLRKCCDHPYLVDQMLQSSLTKGHPVTDILDIGVRSCGKLLLLDKMLQKIRIEGLRVLILSQSGGGSANPMGDILDDFICQRFGYESYERVERGLQLQKKQTSMNMFNDKTKGRFIFLIDSRACGPSIKLSSVDAIIIYSSDWNPVNDLRALQRVTMESQSESVPVFRLYSSCTVEEKALILAKHDHILDSNIQNMTPSLSHSLLSWGASLLFNRLEECQNPSYSSKGANDNELFMDNVALEFLTKLSKRVELSTEVDNGAISKAYLRGSFYSRDIVVVGEREGISSIDGDLPKFWAYWLSLLNGRSPCWQHISEPAQRSRRKIQNMEGQSKNMEEQLKAPTEETDEARIKRRRIGEIIDSSQKSLPGKNKDTILPGNNTSSSSHQIAVEDTWQELERNYLDVTQKGLHIQLKPELSKLYKLLQLPENVISLCEELLEYILKNHQISQEPKGILHAFNLAMCWRAASLLKHKVNHTESLTLAMKNLNYECSEELAEYVYGKLKILKKKFARRAGETSKQNHTASVCKISTCEQETSEKLGNDELKSSQVTSIENDSHQEDTVDIWTEEMVSGERELLSDPGTRRKECLSRDELLSRIMNKRIKLVDKAFFLRRKSIQVKHSNEISSLDRHRQKEVAKLREACSLVVDHLRRRQNHIDQEDRDRKIKCTVEWFTMLLYAFLQHMRCQRNRLEMMQSATWTKESQLKEETLQAAKSGQLDHTFDQRIPLPDSEFAMEEFSHFREVVGSCHVHEAALSPEPLDDNSAVEITLVPSVNALEVIEEEARNIPAEVSIQGPAPQTASLSVNGICSISDGSQGDAPLAVQSLEPSGGDHRSAELVEEGTVGSPLQGDAGMEVNTGNKSTASASSPHFETPASSASREATFPVSREVEALSNLVTQCAQQSLVSSQLLQGEPEQADLSGGASTKVLQSESQQTIPVSSNLLERAQADESQPSHQTDAPPCSVQSAELRSEGQPSIPVYNNLLERTQPDQSQPIRQTNAAPGSVQSAELRSEGQPSIPVYNNLLERTQPDQSQPIHQANAAPGSVQSAELFPVASMMFNHPPIDAEPLKNELHKLRLHMDTLNKVREMKKTQLRTECSIEIEKVKRKYDLLIEAHESTHLQQKKAFDDFYDKVLRNQSLAEDFRAKFISASAAQGAARVQTLPIRRTPQSSQQIPMRPSVVGSLASTSALPSTYRPTAPRPRVQAPQADQPSLSPSPLSHPSLPSSQVIQPPPFIASNLFRATSGTLSPTPPRGNYGVQGESAPRAPAPHLQLRPPRAQSHSIPPGNQQQLPTTRVEATSSALAASSSPPDSHLPPLATSAMSTLHLVLPSPGSNIAARPSITAGTRLSDSTSLSLDAWLTASLGLSSDAPRAMAPVANGPEADVVCLSDDDE